MDQLPPDLLQALDNLTDAIRRSSGALDDHERTTRRIESDDKKRDAEIKLRKKEYQAELDKSAQAISKAGTAVVSFAQSLSTPEGAFRAMGQATGNLLKAFTSLAGSIPLVGGVIKGLGEVGAQVITMLTEQSAKAFATFGKLSSSGVVASFQETRNAVARTGLTFEQLESALGKNSEALAMLGGSALSGSKRLQDVMAMNKGAAEQFQKLGIGFQEFAEQQSNYIAMQARSGFARGKSDRELAEGAREYATELAVLSRLTGKNRQDLEKEQQKLLNNARYRAQLALLRKQGPEGEKIANEMKAIINRIPAGTMQDAIVELFGSGGEITSAQLAKLASQFGVAEEDIGAMARSVKAGTMNQDEFMRRLVKAGARLEEVGAEFVTVTGSASFIGEVFTQAADLTQLNNKDQKTAREEVKKGVAAQKGASDAFATAMNTAQQLANEMQLLATKTETLTQINTIAGEAMLKMIRVVDDLTNSNVQVEKKNLEMIMGVGLAAVILGQIISMLGSMKGLLNVGGPSAAGGGGGGGRLSKFGKFGRIAGGVGGLAGGLALDYASGKLKEAGHETGAKVASVASSALTGAGMGAFFGPVGAAVGGAIGAGVGLYQNWDSGGAKDKGKGDQGESTPTPPVKGEASATGGYSGSRRTTEGLIVHHTGGQSLSGAVSTLKSRGLAYHYMVDRDGSIVPYAPESSIAWHAGTTDKRPDLSNANTVSLSLVASNDKDITKEQAASAFAFGKSLMSKYGISKVYGHGESSSHKSATEGFTMANALRSGRMPELPQARNGGILSGPSSGYLANLHGNEMVQPLNPDSVLQRMATTPASSTTNSVEVIGTIFDKMNDKFDEIIDLLSSNNRYARNIATNTG